MSNNKVTTTAATVQPRAAASRQNNFLKVIEDRAGIATNKKFVNHFNVVIQNHPLTDNDWLSLYEACKVLPFIGTDEIYLSSRTRAVNALKAIGYTNEDPYKNLLRNAALNNIDNVYNNFDNVVAKLKKGYKAEGLDFSRLNWGTIFQHVKMQELARTIKAENRRIVPKYPQYLYRRSYMMIGTFADNAKEVIFRMNAVKASVAIASVNEVSVDAKGTMITPVAFVMKPPKDGVDLDVIRNKSITNFSAEIFEGLNLVELLYPINPLHLTQTPEVRIQRSDKAQTDSYRKKMKLILNLMVEYINMSDQLGGYKKLMGTYKEISLVSSDFMDAYWAAYSRVRRFAVQVKGVTQGGRTGGAIRTDDHDYTHEDFEVEGLQAFTSLSRLFDVSLKQAEQRKRRVLAKKQNNDEVETTNEENTEDDVTLEVDWVEMERRSKLVRGSGYDSWSEYLRFFDENGNKRDEPIEDNSQEPEESKRSKGKSIEELRVKVNGTEHVVALNADSTEIGSENDEAFTELLKLFVKPSVIAVMKQAYMQTKLETPDIKFWEVMFNTAPDGSQLKKFITGYATTDTTMMPFENIVQANDMSLAN